MPRIEVFAQLQWPLPEITLHYAFVLSGLLLASLYLPLLRLAWLQPEATATAQPLSTWAVWTLCRLVAFSYGLFILHDLLFLIVVGADLAGRLAMAAMVVRARWLMSRRRSAGRDSTAAASTA